MQKFPECFQGLGKLKGYQVKIQIDETNSSRTEPEKNSFQPEG